MPGNYCVICRRKLFYYGPDRDKAIRRHRANVGSRIFLDGVLLATRVTNVAAEQALRISEGIEEIRDFVKLPSHVHRTHR